MAAVALALLLANALQAIQTAALLTAALLTAVPFSVVIVLMGVSRPRHSTGSMNF